MADLEIFYPNGHVQANLVYIWDGTKPIPWDGSITVATSGGPIQDGVSAAIKATVFDYTNSNPLAVRLTDVAGDYVSAGGGTQYADGATQATPTGNVILWLDAANVLRAPSSTKPLPVDIKNSSLAITAASLPLPTGAATETTLASLNSKDFATQTTLALIKAKTDNLDVLLSTRALEAGGNLATVKTNTDPLVVAAAGGYIRQDSTATIAKESGGNLAIIAGWDNAASSGAKVSGDIIHDDPDSGEPVKIGGKAVTSLPAVVAANDRVNAINDVYGRRFTRTGREGPAGSIWTQIHVPAANTQATKSQGAAGAGIRNVCTGFTVTLAAGATAPTAINLVANLIDGASGGATYLWRSTISLPAVAGSQTSIVRGNLWIPGTANTAITLEFSAAGGANTIESVSMEGTTVAE